MIQHSHSLALKTLLNLYSRKLICFLSVSLLPISSSLDATLANEQNFYLMNSSMDTCQTCLTKFFVIGEYLHWQTNISGLELSFGKSTITEKAAPSGTIISETSEFDIDPHFNWNPGYRVGVGLQLPNSNFSFLTLWTQHEGKGHRTAHATNNIINQGHTKASLKQLDALITYQYALPTINIEPYLGLRFTKINHKIKSSITTNISVLPDTQATSLINFDDDQHFNGIGPSLKLYGDWTLGCGIGIYGEAGFSLLYGDYSVNFNDSRVNSTPFSSESIAKSHQHLHRFNKAIDLGLGLFWNTSICNNIDIDITLGYECHDYFDLSYLGSYPGDVIFHGGVLSFKVGF